MLNKTNNKVIAKKTVHIKSILGSAIGLRFKRKKDCLNKGYVFHFKRNSKIVVDMFFVSFNLDLVFLDKNKTVIEIKTLKPWQSYSPIIKSSFMIEFVSGLIQKAELKIGDIVEF